MIKSNTTKIPDKPVITNPCACGRSHISITENIVIKKNVSPDLSEYIKHKFGDGAKGCIICDANTFQAAHNMIETLVNAGFCQTAKLDIKSHHADEFMLEDCYKVLNTMQQKRFDYFIAAGAGTIHDITRIIAFENKLPFISYPTASSVDGFVSGIAPLTSKDGMKLTLESASPVALFADINVLASAPVRLTAAGAGDILGKYIALADWRIAHLLTGEHICGEIADLQYYALIKAVESLVEYGENKNAESYGKFCADLLESLVISGICMQYCGNSRPASGAEHHVAHFFEMAVLPESGHHADLSNECMGLLENLHGENVGIGTILCAELYHRFADSCKSGSMAAVEFDAGYDISRDELLKKYYGGINGGRLFGEILTENAPNSIGKVTTEVLRANLTGICDIIAEIPPKEKLIDLLEIIGGVTGVNEEAGVLALRLAPYIRDRFTLLKLLGRIGYL